MRAGQNQQSGLLTRPAPAPDRTDSDLANETDIGADAKTGTTDSNRMRGVGAAAYAMQHPMAPEAFKRPLPG